MPIFVAQSIVDNAHGDVSVPITTFFCILYITVFYLKGIFTGEGFLTLSYCAKMLVYKCLLSRI